MRKESAAKAEKERVRARPRVSKVEEATRRRRSGRRRTRSPVGEMRRRPVA